jgi:hypothetical protein
VTGSQPIHSIARDTKVSLIVTAWVEMTKLLSGDHLKVNVADFRPVSLIDPFANSPLQSAQFLEISDTVN